MEIYAGRLPSISNHFERRNSHYARVYKNIFGKRFPLIEQACRRFIHTNAFQLWNVKSPVEFWTFLGNPKLSKQRKEGEELLVAFKFMESNKKFSERAYVNDYIREFHRFLLFASQEVPMDAIEMELREVVDEKTKGVGYGNIHEAVTHIMSTDLTKEEKRELIRMASVCVLISEQKKQLERTLDLLGMVEILGTHEMRAINLSKLVAPRIGKMEIEDLGIEVPVVEGNLFVSYNDRETLAAGIDWHRNIPEELFDRETLAIIDFFRNANYSKYVFPELAGMLNAAQA